MAEYIEREAVLSLIQKEKSEARELCVPVECKKDFAAGLYRAEKIIKQAPAADVVEVKHGEWKQETKFIITDNPDDDGCWRTVYVCSECDREEWRKEPYCHCGAKMDGGKTE